MIFTIGAACIPIKGKYKDQALQISALSDATAKLSIDPKVSKMELLVITEEVLRALGAKQFLSALENKHPDVYVLYLFTKYPLTKKGMVSAKLSDYKLTSVIPVVEQHLQKIISIQKGEVDGISDELVGEESEDFSLSDIERPKVIERNPEEAEMPDNGELDLPKKVKFQTADSSSNPTSLIEKLKQTAAEKLETAKVLATPKLEEFSEKLQETKTIAANIRIEMPEQVEEVRMVTGDTIRDKSKYQSENFLSEANMKPKAVTDLNLDFDDYIYQEGQGHKAESTSVNLDLTPTSSPNLASASSATNLTSASSAPNLDIFESTTTGMMEASSVTPVASLSPLDLNLSKGRPTREAFSSLDIEASTISTSPENQVDLLLEEISATTTTTPTAISTLDILTSTKAQPAKVKMQLQASGAPIIASNPTQVDSLNIAIGNQLKANNISLEFETLTPNALEGLDLGSLSENREYLKVVLSDTQTRRLRELSLNLQPVAQPAISQAEMHKCDNLEIPLLQALRANNVNVDIKDLTDADLDKVAITDLPVSREYLDIVLPVIKSASALKEANAQSLQFLNVPADTAYVSTDVAYANIEIAVNSALRAQGSKLRLENLTESQLATLPEVPVDRETLKLILPEIQYRNQQKASISFLNLSTEELASLSENSLAQATEYGDLVLKVNNALRATGSDISLEDLTAEELKALDCSNLPVAKEYLELILPELQNQMEIVKDLRKGIPSLQPQFLALSKSEIDGLGDNYLEASNYKDLVIEINQSLRERGISVNFEQLSEDQLASLPILPQDPEELKVIHSKIQRDVRNANIVQLLDRSPEELAALSDSDLIYATKYSEVAYHINNALRQQGISVSFENLSADELNNIPDGTLPYDKSAIAQMIPDAQMHRAWAQELKSEFVKFQSDQITDEDTRKLNETNTALATQGYPVRFESLSEAQLLELPDDILPHPKAELVQILRNLHQRNTRLALLNKSGLTEAEKSAYQDFKVEINQAFAHTASTPVALTDLTAEDLNNLPVTDLPASADYLAIIIPELRKVTNNDFSLHANPSPSTSQRALEYAEVVFEVNKSLKLLNHPLKFEQLSKSELDSIPQDSLPYDREYLELALAEIQYVVTKTQIQFQDADTLYSSAAPIHYQTLDVQASSYTGTSTKRLTEESLVQMTAKLFQGFTSELMSCLDGAIDYNSLEALLYYMYYEDNLMREVEIPPVFDGLPSLEVYTPTQKKILYHSMSTEQRFKFIALYYKEQAQSLNRAQAVQVLELVRSNSYSIELEANQKLTLITAILASPELASTLTFEGEGGQPQLERYNGYTEDSLLTALYFDESYKGIFLSNLNEEERMTWYYTVLFPEDILFESIDLPEAISAHPCLSAISAQSRTLLFKALSPQGKVDFFANPLYCSQIGLSSGDLYNYVVSLPPPYNEKIATPTLDPERSRLIRNYVR